MSKRNENLNRKNYVVALSSGTAAIHLALVQAGVKAGDAVTCQSFTFIASANPVIYQFAKPVFVDSEKDTWNMDPVKMEEAIIDRKEKTGSYPKAIVPVHLYGMPAKMGEINRIAKKYNIPVVEDAAEALGSYFKNQACGTIGDWAALSFNGNKIITTSGGGALICHSEELDKNAKFLATQARDQAPHYQHSVVGYNYRLSNVSAGIGRGQLMILEEHIKRSRDINKWYRNALKDVEGISFQTEPDNDYFSNYWTTAIVIDRENCGGKTREDIQDMMIKEDIEVRPLWKPMHLQPLFKDAPYYGGKVAEDLFKGGLCLPSHPMLDEDDLNRIVEVIKQVVCVNEPELTLAECF